jgi:hypothetical protein
VTQLLCALQYAHVLTASCAAAVDAAAAAAAGLRELFKSIDSDSSGTITVEEMRRALTKWGHKIQEVSSTLSRVPQNLRCLVEQPCMYACMLLLWQELLAADGVACV